jgi:hypothetical protein
MISSSFPRVADQVLTFNKNIVDILSKINSLTTTTESSVDVQLFDEEGILRNFTLPSFTSLKAEIDRLNNNINSLYSIDADGALIQTSNSNQFKKIITVDLNREPLPISSLGVISEFKSKINWFFDSLMDPMLDIELDLSGKIESNVKRCFIRRYIIEFETDSNDSITPNGQSALNSFNNLWRGNANIVFEEFEKWLKTTPGILNPLKPKIDQDFFDLEPNTLLYDGEFSVIRIQEDRINKKLWYVLNTLDYIITETSDVRQLAIGDELIVNSEKTSTRYRVIEVSVSESNPRVRLERIEGIEPIPVGIGTLKIYSPIILSERVKISIGYGERNVLFLKAINVENNLVSKRWSLGTGFYTNDLRLQSTDEENGLTMEQFYRENVSDYGLALRELSSKKIPNKLGVKPEAPRIDEGEFRVVQSNKHLTDLSNFELIKSKYNTQLKLKSQVKQIEDAIVEKTTKLRISTFSNESDRKQFISDIDDLYSKKRNVSSLLSSVASEIILLSSDPNSKVKPEFRLRGFWPIPPAQTGAGTIPQEVVQFRVQYRYVAIGGLETTLEQFKISQDGVPRTAVFSNWNEFKTDVRRRVYDRQSDVYIWPEEDIENPENSNINRIDLPIRNGESIEFRIKSISEVGWPESPIESDWSEIVSINFPDDINPVSDEDGLILQSANREEIVSSINSELEARGLNEHLSDTVISGNRILYHDSSKISSGFRAEDNTMLDLFEYLKRLEDKIKRLEDTISRTRGILKVSILRGNREYIVKNDSETVFNVDCEDYLIQASFASGTNRVYQNNIYSIKEFVVKITNSDSSAFANKLGLLSNRNYLQNTIAYNPNAPQVFWVNNNDELLKSDISGQTRTQINNQFIWMVNYDSVTDESVSRLSENIGNNFLESRNHLTNQLSQNRYNLGYNENTILTFDGNNRSLLETIKWIDRAPSVGSETKLLTTVHPVVKDLETITEKNTEKIRYIEPGDDNSKIIPINIYFKLNSLDPNQTGNNYEYVDLNGVRETTRHIKKLKFMIEDFSENRPFTFTITFNINRNNVIQKGDKLATNNSDQLPLSI